MTRFQRLTLTTLGLTFLLVVIGGVVRATGSGMGCPDWPLCYGQVLPPARDFAAWIEWFHRTVAATIGFLVLGMVFVAGRHRDPHRPRLLRASAFALLLTAFQAILGMITVRTNNSGESVTAHLAAAMLLLATLTLIATRAGFPARLSNGSGRSQRPTLVFAFAAASVFALLLFGANVTALRASLVFPDWPLFGGSLIPTFSDDPRVAALQQAHVLHRLVAAFVGLIVLAAAIRAWRLRPQEVGASLRGDLVALVGTALALYLVQVIVGGLQILTTLAPWTVALHVTLGASIWLLLAAAAARSYIEARAARAPVASSSGGGTVGDTPFEPPANTPIPRAPGVNVSSAVALEAVERIPAPAVTRRDKVRAYVALTKPRIIELLLVTTLPAMVLAARGIPRLDLVVWTLLGGALAAGSANAINCYLDRDIDELMTRTRRRPLPAHAVEPENAFVFGLALGVVSFALLALLVNLLAAFLSLVAIAFYVVVYTMLLKRSTTQNIVIGGAAGALPPMIGYAAVTGEVTIASILLFLIVFYWTPPHFWALSLRLARDYRAANVPMLPVVRGVPETTKQIALYSVLLVALTLVLFAVARLGFIYLAGSVALAVPFLAIAFRMWREGTDRLAMRLYKYSISYLTALFALIVVDVLVPVTRLG